MADRPLMQSVVGWLGDLLEWVRDTLADDAARRAIVADLGGDPASAPAAPQYPPAGLDSVKAYRDATDPGLEALASALQDARAVVQVLRSFVESIDLGPGAVVDEAVRDLLDLLALNYIRLRQPRLYFVLQFVSFVEETTSVYGGEFNGISSLPRALRRLWDFVTSPRSWFDQTNFDDDDGVRRLSDRSLLGLASVAAYRKLVPADDVLYGWDVVPGVPDSSAPMAEQVLARTLTLKFVRTAADDEATQTGSVLASVALLPRTHGGPGVFVSLGGGYSADALIEPPWHVVFEIQSAGAVSLQVSKSKPLALNAPDESSAFRTGLAFEARPDPLTGKAFDFAPMEGTSLSLGLVRVEASLSKEAATLKTSLRQGALVIEPTIFDGFLSALMPADGIRLPFDVAVGLASDRGLFVEGQVPLLGNLSSRAAPAGVRRAAPAEPPPLPPLPATESTGPGLTLRLPVGRSLGPLTVHELRFRVGHEGPEDDRTYLFEAGASLSLQIGPVYARADGIGVRLAVAVPDAAAKAGLGLFDLDLGARPPDGIAIAVDAKGVLSGGGFLFHDRAQQLYAGALQLTLQEKLTLKAFGLVATRMPDGSKGWSLIVFVTIELFRPIPLGMGFNLLGFGGMVALHRTFDERAMREGLTNNTLANVLFPSDPVRNAPQILRGIGAIFPARSGSHMFGLLAKIGWPASTLVLMQLALILEFGNRRRLIVLGRISAQLPTPQNDLLRIKVDAFGYIDFDEGRASVDAVLVDSRLAQKFVLTGAAALRMRWTSGPGSGFVLAVGGLNPRFAPPADLPPLERVAIALASGDNPRITCEAYFAITANTLQFGARAALYAGAYGFSVQGEVGFDVLVQLAPFHFLADFAASVQLKRGSRNLFKVSVAGLLEGPRPLRVSAKASFEILWCDFTIRFDTTLIAGEKPPPPPAVDVLGQLLAALSQPENWSTLGSSGRQHGIVLRPLPPGTRLVLDPLGRLVVKQSVVPLNTTRDVDNFAGAPVAGERRFRLDATLAGNTQDVAPVQDLFAPAQYFAMSDDEKLASPSFESMDAGVMFGRDDHAFDSALGVASPFEFETLLTLDDGTVVPLPEEETYVLDHERLLLHVQPSAVAMAAVRRAGFARFRDATRLPAAALRTPGWVVTALDDADTRADIGTAGATWTERRAALAQLNRATLDGRAAWQLVPDYEVTP